MKVPVINRKEYQVTLETHANVVWVHCDVSKFSLKVLKNMDKAWKELMDLLRIDLYVLRDSESNTPSMSFISRYGFYKIRDITDKYGNPKEIWKRDKSWVEL